MRDIGPVTGDRNRKGDGSARTRTVGGRGDMVVELHGHPTDQSSESIDTTTAVPDIDKVIDFASPDRRKGTIIPRDTVGVHTWCDRTLFRM